MKRTILEAQERHEMHLRLADESEAMRLWRDGPQDSESEDALLFAELSERLGVLLEFFADSSSPRVMAMRTWCVLYAVRPDLIDHEAIQGAADRFGVSQQALCEQLKWFKNRTGFAYVSRVGTCSTDKMRTRMEGLAVARKAKAQRFLQAVRAA